VPFYKSLKITTFLALFIVILMAVMTAKFFDLRYSRALLEKNAIEKSTELSYKIVHDVEVLSRFTDNVHDLNDILMNYLIADINYIAVYKENDKLFYKSFFNTFVSDREAYVKEYSAKVRSEQSAKVFLEKEKDILQVLVRYDLPKEEGEILSSRYGLIYFEYSLARDTEIMHMDNHNDFMFNIYWGGFLLLALYFFMDYKFIRPISKLSQATSEISEGNFSHISFFHKHGLEDEMYHLFRSFENMSKSIKENNSILENINLALEEKTQQAEKANEAKSGFLANMSHEIRTPLNAIVGFIELLLKEETDKKKIKYLSIVNQSSTSLLSIINDILDLSKIESGKLDIVVEDFSPKEVFKNIVGLYKARADEKKINFIVEISPDLPDMITLDPLRVKQILNNLFSNAIKFTPEFGFILFKVSFDDRSKLLIMEVKDSGIGIPKEKQEHIFEAFNQSKETITKEYGGTGLGLTIIKKLTTLLQGKIVVESDEGEGTRFVVTLPVKVASASTHAREEKEAVTFNQEKVLVVEDNATNQLFITLILDDFNLQYKVARNGQEAVAMFKNEDFDIILMDENMPVMNGTEATKKILEIEKDKKVTHTPIVALTANALKGDKERFLQAGMDDYLTKPIDTNRLMKTMQKHLHA